MHHNEFSLLQDSKLEKNTFVLAATRNHSLLCSRRIIITIRILRLHFQALFIISSIPRVVFHLNSAFAFAGLATTVDMSPGRRSHSLYGIFLPHAFSSASTICNTENPLPEPRL